jgi:hypothetical protein
VRFPGHLLTDRAVRDVIDFSEPVGVMLAAVLHFVPDSAAPWSHVRYITDRLAPGSYVVISHVTGDDTPDAAIRRAADVYRGAFIEGAARSGAQVARFFDGLDLIHPGLADAARWRAPGRRADAGRPVLFWAGVGRKPGTGGASPSPL